MRGFELLQAAQIGTIPGDDIVTRFGAAMLDTFSKRTEADDFTPVVVPCCDEQDLPGALLAMSRSTEALVPVVVDNGSCDDTTFQIAQALTPHALQVVERGKIGATLEGLLYVTDTLHRREVLCIDGDTWVPKSWGTTMRRNLHSMGGEPALVCGGAAYANGESLAVDILRTARLRQMKQREACGKQEPRCWGVNYGLVLGAGEVILSALAELNPAWFPGADLAIRDAVLGTGARHHCDPSLAAMVVTRGDRMGNLRSLRGAQADRQAVRRQGYLEQYGSDLTPYPS